MPVLAAANVDWSSLHELLILLAAALLLGTLAERLRQSALVGYLIAGAVVGPNALGWVKSEANVELIAELGIALLLFTIGLELSFRQLRKLGPVALIGGTLQVCVTTFLVGTVAFAIGVEARAATIIGAMVALSSTACVLRVLGERAALESPPGRGALGILLLQDIAVLPLTIIVSAMGQATGVLSGLKTIGITVLFAGGMTVAFILVFNVIVPRLLNLRRWAKNRELPILLAVIMAVGSAAAAFAIGISAAMGAFLAGVLLAASPFATQIRADITPLRTVLLTVFFASLGMLSNPAQAAQQWYWVLLLVLAVVLGKMLITHFSLRAVGVPAAVSIATALYLAQIGEFSFVLAKIGRADGLIEPGLFNLLVSATIITLLVTPYLFDLAAPLSLWIERRRRKQAKDLGESIEADGDTIEPKEPEQCIIIVGFGPAGQAVAEVLMERYGEALVVLDLNPRAIHTAERYGLKAYVGDARQREVLEHAGILHASCMICMLPDPASATRLIGLAREMNPQVHVVARARYHVYRWELTAAGAESVVDEEQHVGHRMAAEVRRHLGTPAEDDDGNGSKDEA